MNIYAFLFSDINTTSSQGLSSSSPMERKSAG